MVPAESLHCRGIAQRVERVYGNCTASLVRIQLLLLPFVRIVPSTRDHDFAASLLRDAGGILLLLYWAICIGQHG